MLLNLLTAGAFVLPALSVIAIDRLFVRRHAVGGDRWSDPDQW